MPERGKNERGVIEMVDTGSLVPEGHLLRQVDGAVDFERLYEIVEPLYSAEEGRRSIDPAVHRLQAAYDDEGWTSLVGFRL